MPDTTKARAEIKVASRAASELMGLLGNARLKLEVASGEYPDLRMPAPPDDPKWVREARDFLAAAADKASELTNAIDRAWQETGKLPPQECSEGIEGCHLGHGDR